jgi:hypothetical protein
MQYRSFGNLEWKVSALGFGCMRLPTTDGAPMSPNIIEDEAVRMIRRAIDAGVTYVDTAYFYHGGQSEVVVGHALREGYRERVKLATKLPVWLVEKPEDFDRLLDEQLQKLGTTHIDCYLLHALNRQRWNDIVLKHGLLQKAEVAKADGRIRHIGFSFHDDHACFEEILNGYEGWDFCQLQYNYMDTENQAGMKGVRQAATRGLAVIVMEPLLGGRLADPPQPVRELMAAAPAVGAASVAAYPTQRTPAEWALQWVWDQPEVSVVLSGMSTMEQVEQNLSAASRSAIGSFTEAEQGLIARAAELYRARTKVACTGCNYCMPCPNEVNIPANFQFFNYAYLFDDVAGARFRYSIFLKEPQRSSACIACGECEEKCPQKLPIAELMPQVSALLG